MNDLSGLTIIHLDELISTTFLGLMNSYVLSHRLEIPDALIAATALVYDIKLYTNNVRDYRFIKGLKLYNF